MVRKDVRVRLSDDDLLAEDSLSQARTCFSSSLLSSPKLMSSCTSSLKREETRSLTASGQMAPEADASLSTTPTSSFDMLLAFLSPSNGWKS